MDTHNTLIVGIVILLVLGAGGVLWYLNEHPSPIQITHEGKDSAPQVIEEHAEYFDITATTPSSVPIKNDAEAVAAMHQYVLSQIETFKEQGNFNNLSLEDIQVFGYDQGRKQSLEITYETKRGPHTISYVFLQYVDTFGAHPNVYYRTFTFDTDTGALLSIGNLFTPGTDYLSLLSKEARRILPGQLAEKAQTDTEHINMDFITDGTKPVEDNFKTWYIEGDTLVLVFPPYQVAAYVFGAPEVRLPLSTLPSVYK